MNRLRKIRTALELLLVGVMFVTLPYIMYMFLTGIVLDGILTLVITLMAVLYGCITALNYIIGGDTDEDNQ